MAKVTVAPVPFASGSRFHDGDDLNRAMWAPQWSTGAGLLGGTAAAPTVMTSTVNQFSTVSAGQVATLPFGPNTTRMVIVFNDGAGALTVVTKDGSTIDGIAGATGVTMSAGKRCMFLMIAPGTWESAQMGAVSA